MGVGINSDTKRNTDTQHTQRTFVWDVIAEKTKNNHAVLHDMTPNTAKGL